MHEKEEIILDRRMPKERGLERRGLIGIGTGSGSPFLIITGEHTVATGKLSNLWAEISGKHEKKMILFFLILFCRRT